MCKTFTIILSLFIINIACSQDMLIEQIAGKVVVRKAFNEEKELTSKQVFKVGELQTKGNKLTVEFQVNLFDTNGKLVEKYFTQYTCKPDKSNVLLTVFPLAGKGDAEYVIKSSSPGFKRLYDFETGDNTLEDLSMEMSMKSGILGFFGSKNRITLTNRRVYKTAGDFHLYSQLTIKAYLWGLKVKTIQYTVKERLNANRTLLSQKFMAEDGSYFLVEY